MKANNKVTKAIVKNVFNYYLSKNLNDQTNLKFIKCTTLNKDHIILEAEDKGNYIWYSFNIFSLMYHNKVNNVSVYSIKTNELKGMYNYLIREERIQGIELI